MNLKLLFTLLLAACYGFAQDLSPDTQNMQVFKEEKILQATYRGDSLEVVRLNKLAASLIYISNDSAGYYAKKAMKLADDLDFHKEQIKARSIISLYLSEAGQLNEALELMAEAEAIALSSKDEYHKYACYHDTAIFYAYLGDIEESNNYYLKVVQFGERKLKEAQAKNAKLDAKTNEYLSAAYGGLSENYFILEFYDKALEYINKADLYNRQIDNNQLAIGQTLANKAQRHLKLDQHEDAVIFINEAIDILAEEEAMDWLAFAERVKGDIYLDQGYYRLALEAYGNASDLQKQLEDPREKASLDHAMSEAYRGQEKYGLTKEYAEMALKKSMMLGELSVAIQSAETLFKTYESEGDLANALYYHKIFKKYSDSLFHEKNIQSVANIEAKQEQQRAQEKFDIQNQRNQNKHRFLLLVSTGGVLILLTVLFMTQRSRKLERKLNDLLTKKNNVLRRRERSLNWMNETKIKLFSIISHDLRSPLASLNNLIDLLNDKQIGPEDFIDFAPQLSNQVKNVSFTLNNLLLWSRQQMKGAQNNPQKHNLHQLANQSVDLLIHQAKEKKLFIRNEIPKEAVIYADADQITIVFRNLISNAIKFTNNNGAIIIKAQEIDGSWEVEVKDTGVGMDQKTIEKLYSQSSYMESTYGTNNEKGTGIGLSLCKEMITKSGGEFRVKSAIGLGSSFFFTLEKYEKEVQEIPESVEMMD
ncbi:sensor histidine kinase [Robertkochia marina]|uniref:histidine kinase n=1 Tax=Robertkochia marina TaxID=1227945 RepID=A0A4S3LZ37_9FLAO|nr:tetratricopeptide repeat-containing sensor histidine kinase [Robertkochia marina]THD66555.1 sensor histidine kinase [Robertkochia marina]TRZ45606.1 two-component sensor histidine kinase [Robertkochia marina]